MNGYSYGFPIDKNADFHLSDLRCELVTKRLSHAHRQEDIPADSKPLAIRRISFQLARSFAEVKINMGMVNHRILYAELHIIEGSLYGMNLMC